MSDVADHCFWVHTVHGDRMAEDSRTCRTEWRDPVIFALAMLHDGIDCRLEDRVIWPRINYCGADSPRALRIRLNFAVDKQVYGFWYFDGMEYLNCNVEIPTSELVQKTISADVRLVRMRD